jgi:methionyl-tRNA synthetase
VNRYVDVSAPWSLAKDPASAADLDRVLYNSLEGLRHISLSILPFMPDTAAEIYQRLGLADFDDVELPEAAAWGLMPSGGPTTRGEALFPRKTEAAESD